MKTFANLYQDLSDIGNALRSKMGIEDKFKIDDIAGTINNMEVLEIPQGLPPSSSEGVIGYVGTFAPISDKVVHSEYGDIVINYNYNRFDGSVNQIFEVTDASNLFANNTNNVMNFDIIKFGNNVTSMYNTFKNCTNFNQPITIGDNITNMYCTFMNCYDFNQPIIIPDSVTNMYSTFGRCPNFNQHITIPDSVTNMAGTFSGCNKFNQPITIPDNVTNMDHTFNNCPNFNQPVTIGNSVTNMYYAFNNCTSFGSSLYFKNSSKLTNVCYMFQYCNNSLRKYIYCNNATPFLNTGRYNSITGGLVTWSTMDNGYYNATYNIYIYNNWTL